jgi:uroporphyrinogen decarboxylase
MDNIKKYYGTDNLEEVLEELGIDFRNTCMEPDECHKEEFSYFEKMGLSIPIDDYYVKRVSDNEYEDEWGVRIRVTGEKDLDWKYSYHPLDEDGKLNLSNLRIPDIHSGDRFNKVIKDIERYKKSYIVVAGVSTLFRKSWILCGYSKFLETLYIDRDFVVKLLDILLEFYIELVKKYVDLGVDIIELGGDLGTEEAMMISPDLWREIFKPRLRKIISKNKKEGVYFYLHSDGNIAQIIPDLIEIGIDILNPIQPECMNPEKIKEQFGKKLILHGTMSLQKTFTQGNKNEIKNEILDRIGCCGEDGGLILAPSNAFTEDVKIENILYFYDFIKNYKV